MHLQPMHDRLSDQDVVAYARPVELSLTDTDEPRIAEFIRQHGTLAILSFGTPMVMLSWPDGAVGPAWFHAGKPLTDCLVEAYRLARECLESIHFQHAPAAAGQH
ncbi:MAG: hypothetical protein DI563_02525 [Variovorax paradoxus]|uniref:Uncharacterized protein n=1 Tax=Variovorax paradoxus TaxID=34073 RepID=A0A2W5QLG1_VARPD|nr:MAG: hypothetical protein DI563_02525 [Variovorax paradoxus]